ncbi:MAG TPA: hypothetical protein VKU00_19770 [Chthonomonadaceae bacterium]|nr:hypothetical protein [Chthonomonadaceae bacterium]
MVTHSRHDWFGRIVGMLVFLLGVALLIVVFFMAYHLFNAPPNEALGLHITGNPKTDPTATAIGTNFGWMLLRVAYLFLMAIAGSLIAQKGINLYFSAMKGFPVHAVAPPPDTAPAANPPAG